jgi:hypothetical protein
MKRSGRYAGCEKKICPRRGEFLRRESALPFVILGSFSHINPPTKGHKKRKGTMFIGTARTTTRTTTTMRWCLLVSLGLSFVGSYCQANHVSFNYVATNLTAHSYGPADWGKVTCLHKDNCVSSYLCLSLVCAFAVSCRHRRRRSQQNVPSHTHTHTSHHPTTMTYADTDGLADRLG